MRKIESKYLEEKRRKRNRWVIGGILIVIMVFSTMGYSFGGGGTDSSKKIIFNGFEFVKQNDFWVLQKDNYLFQFRHNPEETERTSSVIRGLSSYENKPLYIFSESPEAEAEVYINLFYQNQIVQRFQRACFEGKKCDESLPIKTCDDNFIIIEEGEKNEITQDSGCVFIRGNNESLVKNSDEFLFKVLKIAQ